MELQSGYVLQCKIGNRTVYGIVYIDDNGINTMKYHEFTCGNKVVLFNDVHIDNATINEKVDDWTNHMDQYFVNYVLDGTKQTTRFHHCLDYGFMIGMIFLFFYL